MPAGRRQQEIHLERDRSWRRRGNSGGFVGSRLREERRGPVSGIAEASDEVDYFRGGFLGPWPDAVGLLYDKPTPRQGAMLVNSSAWKSILSARQLPDGV
jgi:hypothetical protein